MQDEICRLELRDCSRGESSIRKARNRPRSRLQSTRLRPILSLSQECMADGGYIMGKEKQVFTVRNHGRRVINHGVGIVLSCSSFRRTSVLGACANGQAHSRALYDANRRFTFVTAKYKVRTRTDSSITQRSTVCRLARS